MKDPLIPIVVGLGLLMVPAASAAGDNLRSTAAAGIPSPRPDWFAESNHANAELGDAVATAGDVNGDGYDDVIVGVGGYHHGQENEGGALLYLGSATGLSRKPAWIAEGDQEYSAFGATLGAAGDVNGDGYDDVIVGASLYENGQKSEGRAYVYFGSPAGLSRHPRWIAEGNEIYATFGASVGGAGDVNGDGYDDVIVGAPNAGPVGLGQAYLYFGSEFGLSPRANWVGEDMDQRAFGESVGGAGDVNGDGYDDVVIGVYAFESGQTFEGAVYVYLGSANGLGSSPDWTAEGDHDFAHLGDSVGTAGDVNGDGYDDIIAGAPNYLLEAGYAGRAVVYLGSATGLSNTPDWIADGDQAIAFFGEPVATAGDMNGDGFDDIIVGARGYDNAEDGEGRAYVYLGSATGLSSNPDWIVEGNQIDAQLGFSAGTAGDVNGDGLDEAIVGAPGLSHGQEGEGIAMLYYGWVH